MIRIIKDRDDFIYPLREFSIDFDWEIDSIKDLHSNDVIIYPNGEKFILSEAISPEGEFYFAMSPYKYGNNSNNRKLLDMISALEEELGTKNQALTKAKNDLLKQRVISGDLNRILNNFQREMLISTADRNISIEEGFPIGSYAFYGSRINKFLTNSTDLYGTSIFEDSSITTFVDTVEEIKTVGYKAFKNCTSLSSITIPNVITVAQNAFEGCSALVSISGSFLKSTSIGRHSFFGCSALEEVTFPEATLIGEMALDRCSNLKRASFPKVVKFGDDEISNSRGAVVRWCPSLEKLWLPKTCQYIGGAEQTIIDNLTSWYGTASNFTLYLEGSAPDSNWGPMWNKRGVNSTDTVNVVYNTTLEAFNAL